MIYDIYIFISIHLFPFLLMTCTRSLTQLSPLQAMTSRRRVESFVFLCRTGQPFLLYTRWTKSPKQSRLNTGLKSFVSKWTIFWNQLSFGKQNWLAILRHWLQQTKELKAAKPLDVSPWLKPCYNTCYNKTFRRRLGHPRFARVVDLLISWVDVKFESFP